MQVYDLMNNHVVSINSVESVSVAAQFLKRENIGSLPVCNDNGSLCGIVTDRDIVIRCIALGGDASKMTVGEIMSRNLVTVSPLDSVSDASRKMSDYQVRRLPVCKDNQLVGILSLGDLARNCDCDTEAANALSDISSNIRRIRRN